HTLGDPRGDRAPERGTRRALAPPLRPVRPPAARGDPASRRRARPALGRAPGASGPAPVRRPRADRRARPRRRAPRARRLTRTRPACDPSIGGRQAGPPWAMYFLTSLRRGSSTEGA